MNSPEQNPAFDDHDVGAREKVAKWVLLAIFCLLLLSWPVGLYVSAMKTDRIAADLFRWIHDDPSLTSDSADLNPKETAAQLVERFNESDRPFKKHVTLQEAGLSSDPRPSLHFDTIIAGFSNGSSMGKSISPISTFYFASVRTEPEPPERVYGTVVIVVETSLFGL